MNKRIRIAFVSTNSITQGEQVAQLWPILFGRYEALVNPLERVGIAKNRRVARKAAD